MPNIKFKKEISISASTKQGKDKIALISSALSSQIRIEMLLLLLESNHTITEFSKLLAIPTSSVLFHLKILEKADLVAISYIQKKRSDAMFVSLMTNRLVFDLKEKPVKSIKKKKVVSYDIPLGSYEEANARMSLNAFDENGPLNEININNIYHPSRYKAKQLTIGRDAYLRYKIAVPKEMNIEEISLSLEICSETYYYQNDFKSDVSFRINGKDIITYTCPGDFGGKEGKLNPSWYPPSSSQYGQLVTISINSFGCYLNGVLVEEDININDLKINENPFLQLEIYNKKDAQNNGGINIFGSSFGDYPQDIKMDFVGEEA